MWDCEGAPEEAVWKELAFPGVKEGQETGGANPEISRLGSVAPPRPPKATPLSPPSGGRAQGLWDDSDSGSSLRASWGCTVRIQVRVGQCLGEFFGKFI